MISRHKNQYGPASPSQGGFTLLELTLYVGMAAVAIGIFSSFYSLILESRAKSFAIAEVNEQGIEAMLVLGQALRNANSVSTPILGASDVSVSFIDASSTPSGFYLNSGQLYEQSGGTDLAITNSHVVISNLTFSNLGVPAAPTSLRIQFTLSANANGASNSSQYSQDFFTAASLRK
ncbi:MAG TPA: hypothetical protein VE973_03205 [Candidatus Limnocylindria bacterium]|nr:hypothetical protein [Candidatus Limnocylindria bacterium]